MSDRNTEEHLHDARKRAVYDCAAQCFLALEATWQHCPRRNRDVSDWLQYYETTLVVFRGCPWYGN
jgi:hypothetical protein